MSYLVLARKWRPQTFSEVVGQHHITRILQNAIAGGRVAHAYLFTGARGVGKTSVARILAKTLNCLGEKESAPCNRCSNCREITSSHAVDVLEIDGASNRGIDSIRELRETVRFRPAKSRYKIYIIDEVHMLTTEAFNALLKTLEEPPEQVLFIFATTEPHRIPATILSRCQRLDFRRIPTPELVQHLKAIAAQEDASLRDELLYAVAREADGSMRDAQSLLEQILTFRGDELSEQELLDILGIVDRKSVFRAASAVLDRDPLACLQVVEEIYRRGVDIKRFCLQLSDHFRNLLVLAVSEGAGEDLLDLPPEEIRVLREGLAKTTLDSIHLIFQMLLKADEEIRQSSLPRTTLEMLLLRLTRLPDLQPLGRLMERLEALERRLSDHGDNPFRPTGPGPAGNPVPEPTPGVPENPVTGGSEPQEENAPFVSTGQESWPSAPALVDPSDMISRWPGFLRWLKAKDPILAAKLSQSQVTHASEKTLVIEVLELFQERLSHAPTLAKLTDAAASYFGQEFQWVVRARPSAEGDGKGTRKAKRGKGSSKRSIMEHPAVLLALDILGGDLIDIRPARTEHVEALKDGNLKPPSPDPEGS